MKKRLRCLVAIGIVLCLATSSVPSLPIVAKTTTQKIKDAQKEVKQLQKEISNQQDEVDKLNSKKKALQKEIKKLNTELQTITDHITDLEGQIADKEDEIVMTQDELVIAKETEVNQYEAMKKRIQFMYEDSSNLYMDILFSAKSFADFLTLTRFVESLAEYDRDKLEEFEANRLYIEEVEARLRQEKIDLDALKAEALSEQARVQQVIAETQGKVSDYIELIDDAEEELLEIERKLESKNGDLEALKVQLAEEIRLSQLAMTSEWRDISQVEFQEGDRYLLAVLIYCEAGGEPYEGQVAVAAVVMNRVMSSRYPNTISGVIYQKYQFSPVGSGRLAKYLAIGKTTKSCYNAADAAMSGYSNIGKRTHFRTPIDGLVGIQIGGHIFY